MSIKFTIVHSRDADEKTEMDITGFNQPKMIRMYEHYHQVYNACVRGSISIATGMSMPSRVLSLALLEPLVEPMRQFAQYCRSFAVSSADNLEHGKIINAGKWLLQDGIENTRFKTRGTTTIFSKNDESKWDKIQFLMTRTSIQHVSASNLSCKSFSDR